MSAFEVFVPDNWEGSPEGNAIFFESKIQVKSRTVSAHTI